jgi:tyrosyl-tRNA synthetase
LQREDFAKRWEAHQPISLHELLYPLAQAYDSVAIEADIEMGGQDQTFNILAGRDLQKELGQNPQIALFMPLLVGLDGEKKMSKSLGNYVGIGEDPLTMYSKVMSLADAQMREYFLLCTDVPEAEFDTLLGEAASGQTNPMAVKHRLAREIVALYHGSEAADAAQAEWKRIHSARELPSEMPEIVVPASELSNERKLWIVRLIALAGFAKTNGEARRLVEQGGVTLNDEKVTDPTAQVALTDSTVLKVGKKNFGRVRLS